jgi:branched-chain amino acid aminotransferase
LKKVIDIEKTQFIWVNGNFLNWDDAKIHILNRTLHYSYGAFEGIRCYAAEKGPAIFRLDKHIERLINSCKILRISLRYSKEELINAAKELVRKNSVNSCYIRPIVYLDDGEMGLEHTPSSPGSVAIACWPWGAYLGKEGLEKGVSCKISSFTRHHVNVNLVHAKAIGNYMNSMLAELEAADDGFDEAILLDTEGYVAEGPGENIFIVKNNVLYTTPLATVLEGVTRDSIMKIAKDFGIEVREEKFARDQLYCADEAFFTGTAAEVTPIISVDKRVVGSGSRGAVTKQLQDKFFDIVYGKDEKYKEWLSYIWQ